MSIRRMQSYHMRRRLVRLGEIAFFALTGTWAIVRFLLDWVGRSTVVDDYNQLVERMPEAVVWVVTGTPPWVPIALAFTALVVLIYSVIITDGGLEKSIGDLKADLYALKGDVNKRRTGAKFFSRRLTAEQKESISKVVSSASDKIQKMNVIYAHDSEAISFAADIGDAIKGAEIECAVHQGMFFDHDPRQTGVWFYYSASEHDGLRHRLEWIFRDLGVHLLCKENPENTTKPFFYVARAPE